MSSYSFKRVWLFRTGAWRAYMNTSQPPYYWTWWLGSLIGGGALVSVGLPTASGGEWHYLAGLVLALILGLLLAREPIFMVGGRSIRVSLALIPLLWVAWWLPLAEVFGIVLIGVVIGSVLTRTPIIRIPVRLAGWLGGASATSAIFHYWAGPVGSGRLLAVFIAAGLAMGLLLEISRLAGMKSAGMSLWQTPSDMLELTALTSTADAVAAWLLLIHPQMSLDTWLIFWGACIAVFSFWLCLRSDWMASTTRREITNIWLAEKDTRDAVMDSLRLLARLFLADQLFCYVGSLDSSVLVQEYRWGASGWQGFRELSSHDRAYRWLEGTLAHVKPRIYSRLEDLPGGLAVAGPGMAMGVPVNASDRRLGWLVFLRIGDDHTPWGPEELQTAREMGNTLGEALMTKMLSEQLDNFLLTDPMTNLANEFGLERQWMTFNDNKVMSEVGLLYMDLNGFKAVNDRLGHDWGDSLINLVAERIRAVTKQTDLVARLHGDEFAILLSGIQNPHHLLAVAQRIADEVAQPTNLPAPADQPSMSIGGLFGFSSGASFGQSLRQADMVMYAVKRSADHKPSVVDMRLRQAFR